MKDAALRVHVLWVGKGRDRLIADLATRYEERISRLLTLSVAQVAAAPAGRDAATARRDEAARLIAVLDRHEASRRGARVALDERGELLTSEGLARWIDEQALRARMPLAFVVGGDQGLDGSLRESADLVLSLSRMTLPHELARVVLLEQIYRAQAIRSGHPYHRGEPEEQGLRPARSPARQRER